MYKLRLVCTAIVVVASVVQAGRAQPSQGDPFAPGEQSAAAEAESDSPKQSEDPQVRALRELGGRFLTKGFKSSWSPDGKRLVFGHQEAPYAEEGGGLSIFDLTIGKAKRLVPTGKDASWAPGDGRYIAYVDDGYGADEQIWIVEPSGENRRKVVDGGFPSWSPDGKTIFFHSRKQRKLMAINIDQDEAAPTEIMDSTWWYPVFSFDGKRIAYRSGDQLVLADRQTGQAVKQCQIPGGRGFLGSWSPDGKYVAYGGYGFHDVPGLWIVDVQTGDMKQLSKGFVTMPVWSPDGSKISMDLRLRSGFEVWVLDANIVDSLPKIAQPQDRYAVPEEGIESLLKFIRELQSFRPRSTQEMLEHRAKSNAALKLAAERILKSETDESSEAFQVATMVLLGSRVQALGSVGEDEQKQVIADLAKALQGKAETGLGSSDLMLAMSAARTLEYAGKTALAADAYESFAEAVGRSEDASISRYSISRYAEQFQGAARRLRLPGTFLELKGTLLDGSELDWKSYRGKVVLVDFWATWCGPCRAEIPNVKKCYELYHDRGFDVIGISLDRSKQALENFLQTEKLPWVTLYDEKAGGSHPMATYYGVTAIPTVILVDKEGKVVSLRARGEELGQLLRAQLGPVDAEKVREVEERMQKQRPGPAPRTTPAVRVEPDPKASIGEGNVLYLGCGSVGGPGKVYQVEPRGRIIGSVDLPGTPYGLDVRGDELVAAIPRAQVTVVKADGSISAVPIEQIKTPLDVAAQPGTGDLLVADNGADVLVRAFADSAKSSDVVLKLAGSELEAKNRAVAVDTNEHVLFATSTPPGIYRLPMKKTEKLGTPIVDAGGDVAADRSSSRWAAVTRTGGIQVFDGEKSIASVPFPEGRMPYRGGIAAFGPDGTLVVALQSAGGVALAQVDLEAKVLRTLFEWRGDRLVDFAVGPRMDWPGSASNNVTNAAGDELRFLAFDPPLPHVFRTGERLNVQFTYTLNSADSCRIFARPYTGGERTPGYGAHGSPQHPRGTGGVTGWFTFGNPGRIDQVRIQMVMGGGEEQRTLDLCCDDEIARLTRVVTEQDRDVVIGVGGGKVIDTAKAVAHQAGARVAIVPTIASTDAPTSAVSVIYQLSELAFLLLTGSFPFGGTGGSGIGQLLKIKRTGPVPSIRPYRPDLPRRVDAVLKRAMSLQPKARFASANLFVEELADALARHENKRGQWWQFWR